MRNFKPTAAQRKEWRHKENTQQVDIKLDEMSEEFLDSFLGRIFFWSFTVTKPRPDDKTTIFRVNTHRFIPRHELIAAIEFAFPGCKINTVRGYNFRHTFDVKKLQKPMEWSEIIWKTVRALEPYL